MIEHTKLKKALRGCSNNTKLDFDKVMKMKSSLLVCEQLQF